MEHVPEDFVSERKRLYQVGFYYLSYKLPLLQVNIGMGFIELPQVELPKGVARQEMLETKGVYILDCTSDIFLWTGKKANRWEETGHSIQLSIQIVENGRAEDGSGAAPDDRQTGLHPSDQGDRGGSTP